MSKKVENKKLGTPETIGELKKLIANYPDKTSFCFRNQPRQELFEMDIEKKEKIIYFQ